MFWCTQVSGSCAVVEAGNDRLDTIFDELSLGGGI